MYLARVDAMFLHWEDVQDPPGSKLTRLTTQLSENKPTLQAEMATSDIWTRAQEESYTVIFRLFLECWFEILNLVDK